MIGVSIVMPVYNAAEYINESLNDVLEQTYADYELICVDDGSTDDSGKILDQYGGKDNRIKVIHQDNKGGGIARDEGLKHAKGKYVLFLDADDRFDKALIETAISLAEINGSDVCAFNADMFDCKTGIIKSAPWLILKDGNEVKDNPFEVLNTTIWNKLFLRSFLLENNLYFMDNKYSDTMYFVAMALLKSRKTIVCNQVFVHYRVNNKNSLIANQDKDYMSVYKNLECIRDSLKKYDGKKKQKIYFLRLSEKVLTDRIRMMKTIESYSALYNMLHEGGITKLGFDAESFSNTKEGIRLKGIYEKSLEEDLFEYRQSLLQHGMVSSEVFGLPDLENVNEKCCKIVLYGAGDVGKDYFRQIMNRTDLCLCGWVDKNFASIGFPVSSPKTITDCEYDVVLIAINDEKNIEKIKDEIVQIGIDRSRVVWKRPKIIAT